MAEIEKTVTVPCYRANCFGYCQETGCCLVLSDNHFNGRECPFFKSKEKFMTDRLKAEQRVSALHKSQQNDRY